ATRPGKVVPIQVSKGKPAHSASQAVVWALQGSVSRKRSANDSRAKWSACESRCGAKINRSADMPCDTASRIRLDLAVSFGSASHSTLPSTVFNKRIQMANISGEYL